MRWIRLWAFATSPHGLGMTTEAFWELDAVQFAAHAEVHRNKQQQWGIEMAAFYNGHFQTDNVPWTAEDFVGGGNRSARRAQMLLDKQDFMRLQAELGRMKPGDKWDDSLPEWCKPDYGVKAN